MKRIKNFTQMIPVVFLPFKMILIILIPPKQKRKIGVSFIYNMSDWQVRLVASNYYKRLHKQAKMRLNGYIKSRAKKDFRMDLFAYRRGLYQHTEESHRGSLVAQAKKAGQIYYVFEYMRLSLEQEKLLLNRLWEFVKQTSTILESPERNLFIRKSLSFPEFHEQRSFLQKKEEDAWNSFLNALASKPAGSFM